MHCEGKDLVKDTILIREKRRWNWKPKGRKERQVPIPGWLANELRARRGNRNGLIFPNEETKRPEGHLIRKLKAVVKRANLKATYGAWTLYVFRHTYATMHLQSGADVRSLQKWLGHADLHTTAKYCDWLDAHSAEAGHVVNKTFAAFAPPSPTAR